MSADLRQCVTAVILAQLETADPASWTPPWHGAAAMPRNALTGRRYRGLNTLALWCAGEAHGFVDARWATYRQWIALGAQVRRQQRGSLVLFYRDLPGRAATATTPGPASTDDTTAPRFVASGVDPFWILLANVYALIGCAMRRAKAECRVRTVGASSIQAAIRPRLIGLASLNPALAFAVHVPRVRITKGCLT